eukprot:Rmarinus@m.13642
MDASDSDGFPSSRVSRMMENDPELFQAVVNHERRKTLRQTEVGQSDVANVDKNRHTFHTPGKASVFSGKDPEAVLKELQGLKKAEAEKIQEAKKEVKLMKGFSNENVLFYSDDKVKLSDLQLMKCIGDGAFAKVFAAKNRKTAKYYAVKMMSKSHLKKSNSLQHAATELAVLQRVGSPFVVRLHTAYEDDEKYCFVLNLCGGGDLFTFMAKLHVKRKTMTEDMALFVGAQVLLALEHLHGLGIVFRDLKPENILIDASGCILLTDFGTARDKSTWKPKPTQREEIVGTVGYMSPEILSRSGHDVETDWWSFGVLLYEMLVGLYKEPFPEKETSFFFIFQDLSDFSVARFIRCSRLRSQTVSLRSDPKIGPSRC